MVTGDDLTIVSWGTRTVVVATQAGSGLPAVQLAPSAAGDGPAAHAPGSRSWAARTVTVLTTVTVAPIGTSPFQTSVSAVALNVPELALDLPVKSASSATSAAEKLTVMSR